MKKLTAEQIQSIVSERSAQNTSYAKLAKKYRVHTLTIQNVLKKNRIEKPETTLNVRTPDVTVTKKSLLEPIEPSPRTIENQNVNISPLTKPEQVGDNGTTQPSSNMPTDVQVINPMPALPPAVIQPPPAIEMTDELAFFYAGLPIFIRGLILYSKKQIPFNQIFQEMPLTENEKTMLTPHLPILKKWFAPFADKLAVVSVLLIESRITFSRFKDARIINHADNREEEKREDDTGNNSGQ